MTPTKKQSALGLVVALLVIAGVTLLLLKLLVWDKSDDDKCSHKKKCSLSKTKPFAFCKGPEGLKDKHGNKMPELCFMYGKNAQNPNGYVQAVGGAKDLACKNSMSCSDAACACPDVKVLKNLVKK